MAGISFPRRRLPVSGADQGRRGALTATSSMKTTQAPRQGNYKLLLPQHPKNDVEYKCVQPLKKPPSIAIKRSTLNRAFYSNLARLYQ